MLLWQPKHGNRSRSSDIYIYISMDAQRRRTKINCGMILTYTE